MPLLHNAMYSRSDVQYAVQSDAEYFSDSQQTTVQRDGGRLLMPSAMQCKEISDDVHSTLQCNALYCAIQSMQCNAVPFIAGWWNERRADASQLTTTGLLDASHLYCTQAVLLLHKFFCMV